jgi:hypothetical protein
MNAKAWIGSANHWRSEVERRAPDVEFVERVI